METFVNVSIFGIFIICAIIMIIWNAHTRRKREQHNQALASDLGLKIVSDSSERAQLIQILYADQFRFPWLLRAGGSPSKQLKILFKGQWRKLSVQFIGKYSKYGNAYCGVLIDCDSQMPYFALAPRAGSMKDADSLRLTHLIHLDERKYALKTEHGELVQAHLPSNLLEFADKLAQTVRPKSALGDFYLEIDESRLLYYRKINTHMIPSDAAEQLLNEAHQFFSLLPQQDTQLN